MERITKHRTSRGLRVSAFKDRKASNAKAYKIICLLKGGSRI
jgi:hypothetical protein